MMELLIRRHIPEWADRIDYRTLQPLPTELIEQLTQPAFDAEHLPESWLEGV